MAIRDTSYFGWKKIYEYTPKTDEFDLDVVDSFFYDMAVDSSGTIYAVGSVHLYIEPVNPILKYGYFSTLYRSADGGNSFELVDHHRPVDITIDGIYSEGYTVAVDANDGVYYGGQIQPGDPDTDYHGFLRYSANGLSGTFETYFSISGVVSNGSVDGIAIDSSGSVYVVGEGAEGAVVYKSTTGLSGSFTLVDGISGRTNDYGSIAIREKGYYRVFVATKNGSSSTVRKSTTGNSGSFVDVDNYTGTQPTCMCVDTNSFVHVGMLNGIIRSANLYAPQHELLGNSGSWSTTQGLGDSELISFGVNNISSGTFVTGLRSALFFSGTGLTGSFSKASEFGGEAIRKIFINDYENIYACGYGEDTKYANRAVIYKGNKLTSNSASFGPKMWTPSIEYIQYEVSGTQQINRKLMNISEFPHSSGLFQMPNMVLGTTTGGTVGNTEDDIVQVKYYGSVVYVMWPRQREQQIAVKGFGEKNPGQRSGKLVTTFNPGEIIDVENHDHLTLYCYLAKHISGTLDNIEIKVERRPLKDTGFTTEQSIEYETSGSFTVAKMRDLVYSKQVDYGNLTEKEIGYPIDVPLANVKQIRVSARQTNGQAHEENKNLIVWGRFINSKDET